MAIGYDVIIAARCPRAHRGDFEHSGTQCRFVHGFDFETLAEPMACPDPVLFLPGFPRCPTCGAEAHELTFSPAVDSEETRVLTDFAWRCPNSHQFATALPDVPLVSWRRLTERPYA